MTEQKILTADKEYRSLDQYLQDQNAHRVFLVCGKSISLLPLDMYFNNLEARMGIKVIRFSAFTPNPQYESVVCGVEEFRSNQCDLIIAVGGGSAIDVAKCIKLYATLDSSVNYLKQEIIPNDIPLVAVPTTAGTGSEATRFAVIYYDGQKQSVSDESCIPSAVLFDPLLVGTLPMYQRKSTMLDAFCHSLESFWSVNSTAESKEYSSEAIRLILKSMPLYLKNEENGNEEMLKASYIAGKAINITQTTAGHAMCYKLTSLYGIAHGHAVALCVSKLWPYMLSHTARSVDSRGEKYLQTVFVEISELMGCNTTKEATELFQQMLDGLNLTLPKVSNEREYEILRNSVNLTRLKNNPVRLEKEEIDYLYHLILAGREDIG